MISRLTVAVFLSLLSSTAFAQAPAMSPPSVAAPVRSSSAPTANSGLIDINSASEDQLDALKGIGKVRGQAIIKNRPYKGKDELYQKNILPKAVYDGIKDQIIARQK